LSTITKIFIVLLTISSIFLCGIVVTYVANATNYKQLYDRQRADRDAAIENAQAAKEQLNETIQQMEQEKMRLNNEIASMKIQLQALQSSNKALEAEKEDALRRVNNWAAIVMDFSKTTDEQRKLLEDTLAELNKMQSANIKTDKQLKETTQTLVEKMAVISALEARNKTLLEEKTQLQAKLDQLLRQYGKVIAPIKPVTTTKEIAKVAKPGTADIGLKGLVTNVDPKNSLAEISIGSAQGVKEGMKFHVTRGDEFICDILILDVDTEKAVGILELVQQQPKVGDNISTNL